MSTTALYLLPWLYVARMVFGECWLGAHFRADAAWMIALRTFSGAAALPSEVEIAIFSKFTIGALRACAGAAASRAATSIRLRTVCIVILPMNTLAYFCFISGRRSRPPPAG